MSVAPAQTTPAVDAPSRLATVLFGLMIVAAAGAFFLVQRVKHTPTFIQGVKMTPSFRPAAHPPATCRHPLTHKQVLASRQLEYISFRTAQNDRLSVVVVTADGTTVATVARNLQTRRYRRVSLCWTGHTGPRQDGALARPGEYSIHFEIPGQGRNVPAQRVFKLLAPLSG